VLDGNFPFICNNTILELEFPISISLREGCY